LRVSLGQTGQRALTQEHAASQQAAPFRKERRVMGSMISSRCFFDNIIPPFLPSTGFFALEKTHYAFLTVTSTILWPRDGLLFLPLFHRYMHESSTSYIHSQEWTYPTSQGSSPHGPPIHRPDPGIRVFFCGSTRVGHFEDRTGETQYFKLLAQKGFIEVLSEDDNS